jgi:hypothetical protein
LIEHLQQNEIYVANDLVLGDANGNSGILLYGTNAVGKTSFIRATGVAVIMAQSGLYVPCSSFEYFPYKYIFTRILGNDNISVQQHVPDFQKVYDNYMKAVASVKDSQVTADRFKKGCTMIYIENDRYKADSVSGYYVADFVTAMSASTGKLGYEFQSPLKRYASLKETEYAPTVAMIRSYLEGRPKLFDKDNEFGVRYMDQYLEDMDIAVGHSSNKLVVLLPKHAP